MCMYVCWVGPRTEHEDERLPELDTFEREVDYELTAQAWPTFPCT